MYKYILLLLIVLSGCESPTHKAAVNDQEYIQFLRDTNNDQVLSWVANGTFPADLSDNYKLWLLKYKKVNNE